MGLTWVVLLLCAGCGRTATNVYVDNRSDRPVILFLPDPGRQSLRVYPHTRRFVLGPIYGQPWPLKVFFLDALTGKVASRATLDMAAVEKRYRSDTHTLTLEYPLKR